MVWVSAGGLLCCWWLQDKVKVGLKINPLCVRVSTGMTTFIGVRRFAGPSNPLELRLWVGA